MAFSEIVDVVVRTTSVFNAAAEIDVGVVMLPFRVVVVQQRAYYGEQQGIKGNDDAGLKQLCHFAVATNSIRCVLPGVSEIAPTIRGTCE